MACLVQKRCLLSENLFKLESRMLRILSLFLVTLLFSISLAQANDKTLYVGTNALWPPMEFMNTDKEIIGYDPDYLAALGKEIGLNLVMKNTSWDGIFASLTSDQVTMIMSSVTITDLRKRHYLFTKPYLLIYQAVIVRKGDKVSSLNDLTGKVVGGQIGTTALVRTLKNAKIDVETKTYDDIGLAFEALARGDLFAVMCDSPVAMFYASRKKGYADKFVVAFTTTESEEYGIVLRKGSEELLNKLNKGIDALNANGVEKKISIKWFGE